MKKQENLSLSAQKKIDRIYEAVIVLLEEGCDLSDIKVSDITSRAGVGKGTAYEYFENREEIIANAIRNDMKRQLQSLQVRNEEAADFRGKVMTTFRWIEENLLHRGSGIQFFKAAADSLEIPRGILQKLHSESEDLCGVREIFRDQIRAARAEKLCREELPESCAELTLYSAYIEYFLYIFRIRKRAGGDPADMVEFIYRGILRRLQEETGA